MQDSLDFMKCVHDLGLVDIKVYGDFLTWFNKRNGDDVVVCKLDCVLINTPWPSSFNHSYAVFNAPFISDHCPIIIHMGLSRSLELCTFG